MSGQRFSVTKPVMFELPQNQNQVHQANRQEVEAALVDGRVLSGDQRMIRVQEGKPTGSSRSKSSGTLADLKMWITPN